MKRIAILVLSAFLAAFGETAFAQDTGGGYVPTPVTVSKEKVKLNGKIYLSHVVLERQTLFSIAKAYGVSVEEIYEANPPLRETGLQKNAIILIPFKEGVAEAVAQQEPDGGSKSTVYIEHTVRWYEDLDDIARKYGVSAKEIMDLNGLKNKKLQTRQVLKIPVKGGTAPAEATSKEGNEVTEEAQEGPSTAQEAVPEEAGADPAPLENVQQPDQKDSTLLAWTSKDHVSLSLILPLNAGGKVSEVNMDFYSGVLLAVKDLEAEGLKVNLNVYDLSAGIPPIDALVKDDFVLGPVASRDVEAILQRVDGRVPVISPLDQKTASLAANYRNFIQAPTPVENQYDDLGRWVKEDYREGERILFISEKGAGNVTASVAIRTSMAQQGLPYEILSYAIVEGRGIPNILTEKMAKGTVNRVVVASESEAFIGDVIRNLGIMMGKGYDIVMYAPSKVRTFDTIDGSTYHQASLHISTSYFVDYENPSVDRFVKTYRALFQTEPSQFAFQGYDTARYFMNCCARYGHSWTRMLGLSQVSLLHTDFQFSTDENDNHQNTAVRRIVYQKDYMTTLQK
jgi:LysM repeat protein